MPLILLRGMVGRRWQLFIKPILCEFLEKPIINFSLRLMIAHWFELYYFYFIFRKISDGLFLEISREVAKDYPDIQHNDMIIDNCCMQLVSQPHQFDVMLTTNLYGSIVTNVICGMMGGAGLLSGRNYGNEVYHPLFSKNDFWFWFF